MMMQRDNDLWRAKYGDEDEEEENKRTGKSEGKTISSGENLDGQEKIALD